MARARIAVVGAGWAGAVTARLLSEGGFEVVVFERAAVVGGHARVEHMNGVVYEPNGAHIFHTSNPAVHELVTRFGVSRPYEHCVLTEIPLGSGGDTRLLSWPPQISELETLEEWPAIRTELAALPARPQGDNLEDHVVSMMGPTLYEMFIRGYTEKQWGRDPRSLSASFAPKRIELRDDDYRRLFRDRWEFFPAEGMNSVIEEIVSVADLHLGHDVDLARCAAMADDFEAIVITAALDDLVGRSGELEWRGIEMRSIYEPVEDPAATLTPAYVVNRPAPTVPYTRTVETKHATGQRVGGTVVSYEHPGARHRHYPVPTVDGENESRNAALQAEIRAALDLPVWFAGRLATYRYINQDQAIEDAMRVSSEILAEISPAQRS